MSPSRNLYGAFNLFLFEIVDWKVYRNEHRSKVKDGTQG